MKVLFIGEGRHDIGDAGPDFNQPRPAHGTIPTLARRACDVIGADSIALAWTEIRRFNPAAKKPGLAGKVVAAALLADRKYNCSATVAVADRDGDLERANSLQDGAGKAVTEFPRQRVVWGLAVESIEAWTLGAHEAMAEELAIDVSAVRQELPRGKHIEELSERSGKQEHRPKMLLQRITQLKNRTDCTEFRQAVAEKTDVEALAAACDKGFKPFLVLLRSILQPSSAK